VIAMRQPRPYLSPQSHSRFNLLKFRLLLVAATLLTVFGSSGLQAMWAGMSDAELVEKSVLIVKATYIGSTQISVDKHGKVLKLGVLAVEETLKGDTQQMLLLHLPVLTGGPQRSDAILFRPGQKGLWFLKKSGLYEGSYLVDHPQRFIPVHYMNRRIGTLRKLLEQ